MDDDQIYTPPKVWTWDQENGGKFASINRPIAGATHDKELPVGKHPLQLYSLATPNGVKVSTMLEETGLAYERVLIDIHSDGERGEHLDEGRVRRVVADRLQVHAEHVLAAAAEAPALRTRRSSQLLPDRRAPAWRR